MALADTANLVVQLRLDDRLSPGLARASSSLRGFQAGIGQMGKGVGQLGAGLARIGTIAATGFAVGVGAAVKAAGDFEAQLNTINTIVKLKGPALTTLGEGIRQTFTATGVPLEELTGAYYDLLSAGVKVTDAQSVLNTAVKLGIGGLATTKESVDLLTTAINSYGLNASGAATASDIFAAAVRDGKVTVAELSGSFADVAPLAAQAGVKLEELGAAYATLTARGVPAAEVGTQVNRAIIELLKPGPDLIKVMKGLGLASFETSIKQKGLVATLEAVRIEAKKQGIPFQDLFGRLEGYKFALATTGQNLGKFNLELAAMGQSAGETAAQFAERQKGLNYQLAVFKAGIENAGITIGQALIPKLVPLITKLNEFLSSNQGKIAEFGQKLADGFASFADRIQTIDFSGVTGGLKLLGDVGKRVVDIFLSLPPNIQGLLVAGLAVNKLSGGLLGSGVGNIAGGILKIVFQKGQTPANPLWVASVGGLGGGVPGGGGIIGGITKFLGIGTAVGLGAILGKEIGHAVFFDPTIKPAVEFEQSQFQALVGATDLTRSELTQKLASLDDNIAYLAGPDWASQLLSGFLYGDQIQILKDQRDALQAILDKLPDSKPTKAGGPGARDPAIDRLLGPNHAANTAVDPAILRLLAGRTLPNSALPTGRDMSYLLPVLPHIVDELRTSNRKFDVQETILRQINAKPFSFSTIIKTVVNARLSVTQALNTISITDSIRYDGKTVPL